MAKGQVPATGRPNPVHEVLNNKRALTLAMSVVCIKCLLFRWHRW